jgi:hypothetical protein
LQKRIERLGSKLLQEIESWEVASREPRRLAVERIEQSLTRAMTRQSRHDEKLARRAARKAEKRKEEQDNASIPGAVISFVVALACIGLAVTNHDLFWLVFVALGFGSSGARQLTWALRRERAEKLPAHWAQIESQTGRNEIDPLCDQLLADLKSSPEAVRAFVVNPEKTIESLRATCHALAARRQQLAGERAVDRLAEVERHKRELSLKRDAAGDATARQKLGDALTSLDGQVGALRQLSAAHERVDGEYTSLLVTLQELRTRVSLAKSAGTSVQLEGLKQSVGRLNTELEAITEALESGRQHAVAKVDDGEAASSPRDRVRS